MARNYSIILSSAAISLVATLGITPPAFAQFPGSYGGVPPQPPSSFWGSDIVFGGTDPQSARASLNFFGAQLPEGETIPDELNTTLSCEPLQADGSCACDDSLDAITLNGRVLSFIVDEDSSGVFIPRNESIACADLDLRYSGQITASGTPGACEYSVPADAMVSGTITVLGQCDDGSLGSPVISECQDEPLDASDECVQAFGDDGTLASLSAPLATLNTGEGSFDFAYCPGVPMLKPGITVTGGTVAPLPDSTNDFLKAFSSPDSPPEINAIYGGTVESTSKTVFYRLTNQGWEAGFNNQFLLPVGMLDEPIFATIGPLGRIGGLSTGADPGNPNTYNDPTPPIPPDIKGDPFILDQTDGPISLPFQYRADASGTPVELPNGNTAIAVALVDVAEDGSITFVDPTACNSAGNGCPASAVLLFLDDGGGGPDGDFDDLQVLLVFAPEESVRCELEPGVSIIAENQVGEVLECRGDWLPTSVQPSGKGNFRINCDGIVDVTDIDQDSLFLARQGQQAGSSPDRRCNLVGPRPKDLQCRFPRKNLALGCVDGDIITLELFGILEDGTSASIRASDDGVLCKNPKGLGL